MGKKERSGPWRETTSFRSTMDSIRTITDLMLDGFYMFLPPINNVNLGMICYCFTNINLDPFMIRQSRKMRPFQSFTACNKQKWRAPIAELLDLAWSKGFVYLKPVAAVRNIQKLIRMNGICKTATVASPVWPSLFHLFGPSLFVKSAASKSTQMLASQLIGQSLQYPWYYIKRNARCTRIQSCHNSWANVESSSCGQTYPPWLPNK